MPGSASGAAGVGGSGRRSATAPKGRPVGTLGNGPDELTMRHGLAHILGNVDGEQQSPLLMTTAADTPLLAGEGHEELVAAVGASHSGKAFPEVSALEDGTR